MAGPIEGNEPTPGVNQDTAPKQPVSAPKASQKKGSEPAKDGQPKGGGAKKKRKRKPIDLDPGKDTLSPKELEREYGFGYKFFKSDPELWDLLQKAIKNNWSRARFQAKLQDTKWFQTHSDVWRQNTALQYTDPATYRERLNNYKTMVGNLAGQYGADLTKRELNTFAERAYLFNWNEGQILDHIAKQVTPNKQGNFGGQLAGVEQQLREIALNNGVRIPQKQLTNWMRQIVRGNADVRQFENHIRGIAAKTFGAYGDEILGGMDAVDVASPYIQSMADILELNPAEVNMYDKTIRRAMSFRNPKTGEHEPMSITDFEDSLRADKRWQYTDGARQQMKQYAIELGKMWGILS